MGSNGSEDSKNLPNSSAQIKEAHTDENEKEKVQLKLSVEEVQQPLEKVPSPLNTSFFV